MRTHLLLYWPDYALGLAIAGNFVCAWVGWRIGRKRALEEASHSHLSREDILL